MVVMGTEAVAEFWVIEAGGAVEVEVKVGVRAGMEH